MWSVQADAVGEWTVWESADAQCVTRMVDELPCALSDSSLPVRLQAASAVTVYVCCFPIFFCYI